MDSLLLMQDDKGRSLLHLAVEQDYGVNIKVLMKEAEHGFAPDLLEKVSLAQDNSGKTPLMSAFIGNKSVAISTILDKTLSTKGLMVKALTKADTKGESPIELIIRGAYIKEFKKVAEEARKQSVFDDIANFKNNNGDGILEIMNGIHDTGKKGAMQASWFESNDMPTPVNEIGGDNANILEKYGEAVC
jgi:hypothetical protein